LTDGGGFWGAIGEVNDSFGTLGLLIVGIFVGAWLISYVIYRIERYDDPGALPLFLAGWKSGNKIDLIRGERR
jgi:high-affinity nickel-transport protein